MENMTKQLIDQHPNSVGPVGLETLDYARILDIMIEAGQLAIGTSLLITSALAAGQLN
jgi:hypothetical protein